MTQVLAQEESTEARLDRAIELLRKDGSASWGRAIAMLMNIKFEEAWRSKWVKAWYWANKRLSEMGGNAMKN